jgi:hypothetical protein
VFIVRRLFDATVRQLRGLQSLTSNGCRRFLTEKCFLTRIGGMSNSPAGIDFFMDDRTFCEDSKKLEERTPFPPCIFAEHSSEERAASYLWQWGPHRARVMCAHLFLLSCPAEGAFSCGLHLSRSWDSESISQDVGGARLMPSSADRVWLEADRGSGARCRPPHPPPLSPEGNKDFH